MNPLALIPAISTVIDKIWPDAESAAQAKLKLFEMEQRGELEELIQRGGIIKSEAESEHWLTATWRPIVMLVFTGLIVARWFGFTTSEITPELEAKLFDIIQIGIGGYVFSRGAEKVMKEYANKSTS